MKQKLYTIAVLSILFLLAGCQSDSDRIKQAMTNLEYGLKGYAEDQDAFILIDQWKNIDVKNTPQEFKVVFTKARIDFEKFVEAIQSNQNQQAKKELGVKAKESLLKLRDKAVELGVSSVDEAAYHSY